MAVMNAAAEVLLGINESSEDQIKKSDYCDVVCLWPDSLYCKPPVEKANYL